MNPHPFLFRDKFLLKLNRAIRKKEIVAVMFIDIDRFQRINEAFGYLTGDKLLHMVGERIRDGLSPHSDFSRYGGDEFTVIVSGMKSEDEYLHVAKDLVELFQEPFLVDGQELHLSISIGVSLYPQGGHELDQLLRQASIALSQAKKERQRIKLFTEAMGIESLKRVNVERELRRAIENKEFLLYYQPLINAKTGKLEALEALIRWNHPGQGILYPTSFIGIAEETGLIIPIGEWVIEEACWQNQKWQAEGFLSVPISVNLSPCHFQQKGIVAYIQQVLHKTGLPPQLLELEITESISMYQFDYILHTLQELTGLGIEIAIDDFGTGYSSLGYLKEFPIGSLKIDRSFVQDIASGDGTLANTVITLAHQLNIKVTAEGVENCTQFEYLKERKCDRIQGFLFGKPAPADQIQDRFLKIKE